MGKGALLGPQQLFGEEQCKSIFDYHYIDDADMVNLHMSST